MRQCGPVYSRWAQGYAQSAGPVAIPTWTFSTKEAPGRRIEFALLDSHQLDTRTAGEGEARVACLGALVEPPPGLFSTSHRRRHVSGWWSKPHYGRTTQQAMRMIAQAYSSGRGREAQTPVDERVRQSATTEKPPQHARVILTFPPSQRLEFLFSVRCDVSQ